MGFEWYLRYNRESLGYLSHDLDLSGVSERSVWGQLHVEKHDKSFSQMRILPSPLHLALIKL